MEVVGDGGVLAVEDVGVGQVEQVLGDRDGLGAGVAGGEQVGRLVGDGHLDVPVAAGEPQVGVEALDRFGAEPELFPGFVADDDAQVAGGGEFAHAAAPGVEAGQGDADGLVTEGFEPRQRQGLDGGIPVDVDGGGAVEQARERAGDQLAQGVSQEPSLVEELAGGGVAALGDQFVGGLVEQPPQLRDGRLHEFGVCLRMAGQVGEGGLHDDFVDWAERDAVLADALRSDEAADQGEPSGEHDRHAPPRLGGGEVRPALAEGSEGERVDAGRQSVADGDRLDAKLRAEGFVLVFGVTGDQGAVTEGHEPGCEGLDGGGLAASGFAEDEHVGVGDADRVVEDPAAGVGVEAPTRLLVDAHERPGGRQPGPGDERPQHARLVGRHPRHRRRRGRGRAAVARLGHAPARDRPEEPRFPLRG